MRTEQRCSRGAGWLLAAIRGMLRGAAVLRSAATVMMAQVRLNFTTAPLDPPEGPRSPMRSLNRSYKLQRAATLYDLNVPTKPQAAPRDAVWVAAGAINAGVRWQSFRMSGG